jgi:mandelamide amidase
MDAATQLSLTATEVVAAIRSGALGAQDHVRTLLAHAHRHADLAALIHVDEADALEAAARIDRQVAAGEPLPALAGLPILVKDNINTRGRPTTGGTPALRHACPTTTAPTLQALLDAGAIVLAKTNLHELAFGITSTNLAPFAGPVRNPYDRTRIPGGSSGGTAAAVAARIATCGLGTDTGGSTRVPAALCGIVGLRPSVGDGGAQRRYHDPGAVVPISRTRDTVGPMGRTVADVALLDAVVTGTEPARPVPLVGLRLGMPLSFQAGMAREVAEVMGRACARLVQAGAELVEVEIPGLFELDAKVSFQVALHEPIEDIPAYLAASGIEGIGLADVAAQVASPDVQGAFSAILADAFGGDYAEAMTVHRPAMQALYAQWFTANRIDAMLFPTTIAAAVPIDAERGSGTMCIDGGPELDTFATFIRNTGPASNAGLPGLSIPAGMTAGGLPVGLEIDGPLGSDRRLLGIGLSIEAVLGTLPPPPA